MEGLTISDEHYTLLAKRKNQQKRTKSDGFDALFDGCSIEGIDNDGDESGKQEPLSDAFTSLNQHQEANEDFVPYHLPPSSESVHEYMNSREMTKVQEKWNALTVLLSPIYCFYYFSSGSWIVVDDALISERMYNYADELSCLKTKQFLPPPPILFAGLGIIVHFPFSFIYHWKYAVELPPGLQRISHWSRRLDHCFIHFITTCYAFSSSGSWTYFLLCSIFNAYCGLSHFRKRVRRLHAIIVINFIFQIRYSILTLNLFV